MRWNGVVRDTQYVCEIYGMRVRVNMSASMIMSMSTRMNVSMSVIVRGDDAPCTEPLSAMIWFRTSGVQIPLSTRSFNRYCIQGEERRGDRVGGGEMKGRISHYIQ